MSEEERHFCGARVHEPSPAPAEAHHSDLACWWGRGHESVEVGGYAGLGPLLGPRSKGIGARPSVGRASVAVEEVGHVDGAAEPAHARCSRMRYMNFREEA